MTRDVALDRRSYLASGAALATGALLSGCLGVGPLGGDDQPAAGAHEGVVLDTPEGYDELTEARDDGYLHYPIHGDELPEATLPCAFHDTDVGTRDFVGDRHVLMTFAYTRCPGVCISLVASVAHAQAEALAEGYGDEFAFLPVTFDPTHDTPDRLAEYSEARGADLTAENWHYLRPESDARVDAVVNGRFGVEVEYVSPAERTERDRHEDMAFDHLAVILLANAEGYVERAYVGERIPTPAGVLDDVAVLRDRW